MAANSTDDINATLPERGSFHLSDRDRMILDSVHSSKRCASLDSVQPLLGSDVQESSPQPSEMGTSTPLWDSLSIDPSMVSSSLFFTESSSEEKFDEKDGTTTSYYPENHDETLNSNSGLSSISSSHISQLTPSSLLAKTMTSKQLIDYEDEISSNDRDENANQSLVFTADSFAAIGRSLLLGISSESDKCSVNDDPFPKQTSPSNCHMDKKWWSRFQTDDDWESFRVHAEEYLNALIMQQMANSKGTLPLRKWAKPCGGKKFQNARVGRATGDPSVDLLVSLVEDLVSVQKKIKKLPPIPLHVPVTIDRSPGKTTPPSESLCIPSHLMCHICEEIVIGATLIDCQHCDGSESNGGAMVFCWKCLEEATCLQIDQLNSNEAICPFCNPRCNFIGDVGSSRLTFCRPVPCQALDVAIANTIKNIVTFSQENNEDFYSGCLSGNQLVHRYHHRLVAWMTETISRRVTLERRQFECRERILAVTIYAEERQFWGSKNRERSKSSHEKGKDHEDASLLGSENDEGYFKVIDRESSTWDELGEEVAAGPSSCSRSSFQITFVAAATSLVAIFFAAQARRN